MSSILRLTALATVVVVSAAVAACGGETGRTPLPLDPATDCPAAVAALIRSAPPSADDPAAGLWLGRVDHLRDLLRKYGDRSAEAGAELDWAGRRVALDGIPPQLAIAPLQATCGHGDSTSGATAPASVIPAARAWLRANPPAPRKGMTAGIITAWAEKWLACPAPSRGSAVAMGNGCPDWRVTLTTAIGTLRAHCGSGPATCTSATALPGPQEYFPDLGDELYVPDGGQISRTADILIICRIPWDSFQGDGNQDAAGCARP